MGLVEDPDLDPGIHPTTLVPLDLMPHVFPPAHAHTGGAVSGGYGAVKRGSFAGGSTSQEVGFEIL